MRLLKVGILDLLLIVAAILVVLWLLGFVFLNLGTFIWILLIIAVVIIVIRFASGRKL